MSDLTDKQAAFVKEYIVDFNATQAAIRAGYSKDTARQMASETMSKLYIQDAINDEIDKRNKRVVIKQDRVIYELAKIALSDIKNYLNEEGKIDLEKINDLNSSVVQEINTTKTEIETEKHKSIKESIRLKLYDKMKALEMLGRHLKMWDESSKLLPDGLNVNVYMPENNRELKKDNEQTDNN